MLISTQETLIYKSISPEDIYCYTPGITVTSTGRLVVTFDLGGKGVKEIYASSQLYTERTRRFGIGKIFVSDDQGASWCFISDFNFWHARPFCIGEKIYIIGNAGDLCIICSEDDGPTYIWKTAEKVAETFGLTLEETVNATRKNTLELFKSVNKPI